MTTSPTETPPTRGACARPTTGPETGLAEVLAQILGVERVPVESDFFDDLGADSLLMAQFCARVRARADLPSVSMKDVYGHPTIRDLAAALAPALAPPEAPAAAEPPPSGPAPHRASTPQYVLCGALQLLLFLGSAILAAAVAVAGYEWISAGAGLVDTYLRAVLAGAASFAGLWALPIAAKWLLIGRWTPREIPVWSLAYLRFWIVKTLVQRNPVVLLLVGSPLYPLYLRALGARIGRGALILTPTVPVCTDLLTIGHGAVVRKDSYLTCYRAHSGVIQTGPVTVGEGAVVGEMTVLDVGTALGDGAQLGHSSSMHSGQAVPDGERWHGSPAQPVDRRPVDAAIASARRRVGYSAMQILGALLVLFPLALGAVALVIAQMPQLAALLDSGSSALASWTLYRDALAVSFVLFFGAALLALLVAVSVPRALNRAIQPDRAYRLYGVHYTVHRTIARLTNIPFFTFLFGDSSYIVHYLRAIGYRLTPVKQTGSNFGLEVKHDNPFLCSVGTGTVVADGLSLINAEYSGASFSLSRASVGPQSFLGNDIAYPARGRTGDDCLLATKVGVPLEGEVREGVGLLGSPSFEIPRSVMRDSRFDHLGRGEELRRRLAAKNRHNLVTMGWYLLVRWIYVFGITLLAWAALGLYPSLGPAAIALPFVLTLPFAVLFFALVERVVAGFKDLRPRFCSIYDPYFWWHERFWKVPAAMTSLLLVFDGTPFKSLVWRLLGVRVGRRLFDDGSMMVEKTMVTIGDDVTLNVRSLIQCHSQEDGTFKSDDIAIGSGATIGIAAFVHYGATMGDGAVLAPDSFLMKGEEMPAGARWGGNPAAEGGPA